MWKKILPFVQSYKVTPPLHHPKNNFMSKWHLIQPLQREIYKKPMLISYYSRQEQKSLVMYHTLQSLYVCVWLVNTLTSTAPIGSPIICMWSPADICEQWDEFVFQFSRCSWGRNAWRTPKNVCVGGWWYQGTAWSGGIREILLLYPVVSRYSTIWFLWYNRDAVSLSYGIKIQHDLVSTV